MGFSSKQHKPSGTATVQRQQNKEQEDVVQHQKEVNSHPDKGVEVMRSVIQTGQNGEGGSSVQPKLTVGQPGDKYEKEADETADRVMASPAPDYQLSSGGDEPSVNRSIQLKSFLQRVEESGGDSIQPSRTNGLSQGAMIQRVLHNEERDTPNDMLNAKEDDAIQMKEFLQTMSEEVQPSTEENQVSKQEFLQTVLYDENSKEAGDTVQRKVNFPQLPSESEVAVPTEDAPEEVPQVEEAQETELESADGVFDIPKPKKQKSKLKPPKVQKKAEGDREAGAGFELRLNQAKESGRPLPRGLRREMEVRFKRNFKHIRIHTDSNAAMLCDEIGARAFANGCHIFFNSGEFDPNSFASKKLLAHELTHTIQQGTGSKLVQRFKPDTEKPTSKDNPPKINDGNEVKSAGDDHMKGHDKYDEDAPKSRSEMDMDDENATPDRSDVNEEKSTVNDKKVGEPKIKRDKEALNVIEGESDKIDDTTSLEEKKEGDVDENSKEEKKEASPAEQAAINREKAIAEASKIKDPKKLPEFKEPNVEKPVDSAGEELPGDTQVDMAVKGLGYLGKSFREKALELMQYGSEQIRKAYMFDAVIESQKEELELGNELSIQADKHSEQRKELSATGKLAQKESEERQTFTEVEAPKLKAVASDGLGDAGDMAKDTTDRSNEHKSEIPEDKEAAVDAEKQGSEMNEMGTGATTIFDAFSLAESSMIAYQQDADLAKKKNEEAAIETQITDQEIVKFDDQNTYIKGVNQKATEDIANVEFGPEEMRTRAASIEDGGFELFAASVVIEKDLHDIQDKYYAGMANVKSKETLAREQAERDANGGLFTNDQMWALEIYGLPEEEQEALFAQMSEEDLRRFQAASDSLEQFVGSESEVNDTKKKNKSAYQEDKSFSAQLLGDSQGKRETLNMGASEAMGMASDPRMAEAGPIEDERKKRLNKPLDIADRNMKLITYAEQAVLANKVTAAGLKQDVSNIFTLKTAGTILQGLVDPRLSIAGVFGGVEKIAGGIVNFSEHWKKDPLGAVLRSGADIATGIAMIAGSILGLCTVIQVFLLAITIASWMFLSPINFPSMAWMGTLMTFAGYTSMIAGALSYKLNELSYQHNLHQAASAPTAREWLGNSMEMRQNAQDGAVGLLAVLGGKGAIKMGKNFNINVALRSFRSPKRFLASMRSKGRKIKKWGAGKIEAVRGGFTSMMAGGKALFSKMRARVNKFLNRKNKPLDVDEIPMSGKQRFERRKKSYDKDGNEITGPIDKNKPIYNQHGERIMTNRELKAWKRKISTWRGPNGETVKIVIDKYGRKMKDTAAAAFDYENGIIYLRNRPTRLELFHETRHAKQWIEVGKHNYQNNFTQLAREEFVFREIMRNKSAFSPAEILRSKRVIHAYREGIPAWRIPRDWVPPNTPAFTRGKVVGPTKPLTGGTGHTTGGTGFSMKGTKPKTTNPRDMMDSMLDDLPPGFDATKVSRYLDEFEEIPLTIRRPVEFGGPLMKRPDVDLYLLGRTKGSKIEGGRGSYIGTLNLKDYPEFTVLRQPIPEHIKLKYPNSLADQTAAYWKEINGPFIDQGIKSGADFRFIQDPRKHKWNYITESQKVNYPELFGNISKHKTYLWFEYNYLKKHGYVLLDNGLMIKK